MGEYGTIDRRVVTTALADAMLGSAASMNAAVGSIASILFTADEPLTVDRFGYRPITAFNYNGLTAQGVLTLYKYPAGVAVNKVPLGTINLVDGALVFTDYVCDIDNQPVKAVAPYAGVADLGLADLNPGDQLAIWVTTQATGGTYIAGTFQPFYAVHTRAENEANMASLVNLTPVKAAVSNNLLND